VSHISCLICVAHQLSDHKRPRTAATADQRVRYASLVPDESPGGHITPLVKGAVRWRARSNRQVWLVTLALVIATCVAAITIPSHRSFLLVNVVGLVITGWMNGESRGSRREREALAARLVTQPRDDIPPHVIDLLIAGRKIQAIKRYRELTGTSLKEAKGLIDSL
jgi:hypothetical protein